MKPAEFEYHRPRSLAEVLDCLEQLDGEVSLLAGGQSLAPMLNLRLARPNHLVDLNDLVELDYVRDAGARIDIGALTRHHRLATDPEIRAAAPILAAGAATIGHYAIRQRGTLGGSLAHADPAAQLPILALLLDAEIDCAGRLGRRSVPAGSFFRSVMTTALMPGEVITGVRFMKVGDDTGWGFELFSRRQGDFAIVAAAALVRLHGDGRVAELKLALGGVGAKPIRLDAATETLLEQRPDEAWLKSLADAADAGCAIEDEARLPAAFRRDLVRAMTRRAVAAAVVRAGGAENA